MSVQDETDTDEKAGLISDILAGTLGEDALSVVEGAGQEEEFSEEQVAQVAREFLEEAVQLIQQELGQQVKSISPSPFLKHLTGYLSKGRGQQCKQGENASKTECIPAKKESSKAPAKKPTRAKPESPPSDPFAKAPAKRGAMIQAVRDGAGKDARIVLRNGQPAPEHIKPAMVAPDWTNVEVSLDPDSELLVKAVDNKGRIKSVYSDALALRTAAVKFARVDEMIRQGPAIDKEIQVARQDPKTREQADCAWLMSVQATRPGSKADTGAKVKAYGATTLEGRHVLQDANGKVRLRFVGKEGVLHDHEVRNPQLAQMLLERKKKAGEGGKLFNTNETAVNAFIGKLDGGHFSAKDFRTRRANLIAVKAMKKFQGLPRDEKQYKARIKAIAYQVSTVLGNRPLQCQESYINMAIFSVWRTT